MSDDIGDSHPKKSAEPPAGSKKTRFSEFRSLELMDQEGRYRPLDSSEQRVASSSGNSNSDSFPEPVPYQHDEAPAVSPKELVIHSTTGKRYYDLSFYVDSTTAEDWKSFFKKLSDFHIYVTIFVVMNGREVRYVIESDKYLENGNAIFHPFRVSETNKPEPPKKGLFFAKVVFNDEVVNLDSQEHVKRNRAVNQVVLKFGIKVPLDRPVAFGRVYYDNGQSDLLLVTNAFQFLSFSMLKTMDKQVEKVKAELKNSDMKLKFIKKKGIMFRRDAVEFGVEDFDFFRHGLVVGQTGSGKSRLLELYVRGLINSGLTKDYTVIFFDPHTDVYNPANYPGSKQIDFKSEAVELFANVGEPPASTELTMILFGSFLELDKNPQLARLLKHSLFLLFSIKKMSFNNLNLLLTDTPTRKQFVRECNNEVLQKFFDTEFLEFQTKKYDATILPIVNLINEFNLLSASIDKAKQHSLVDLMGKYPVLFVSANPSNLGRNMTKLIGGALVQQAFTLLQSGATKKKVILVIDEFSLVQNPAFAQILAEARKFGLTMIMAQQYLGQVDLELLQSIQSNVANLFCFKLSRKDAEIAKKMMTLEISAVFENGKTFAEIEEKKLEILTESNPRECVFRVMQGGQFTRPLKAKTVDLSEVGVGSRNQVQNKPGQGGQIGQGRQGYD